LQFENETAVESLPTQPFFVFWGLAPSPSPAPETCLDSLIRSRWLERFAPFSFDEKEMV
jgi:hypothetical protein